MRQTSPSIPHKKLFVSKPGENRLATRAAQAKVALIHLGLEVFSSLDQGWFEIGPYVKSFHLKSFMCLTESTTSCHVKDLKIRL